MSRHTLRDGVSPDLRIVKGVSFDIHRPELSSSPVLLGDYYKRGLAWADFVKRFQREINNPVARALLMEIARMSLVGDVTLLCIEESPMHCHRRLLAEECQRLVPEITIKIM